MLLEVVVVVAVVVAIAGWVVAGVALVGCQGDRAAWRACAGELARSIAEDPFATGPQTQALARYNALLEPEA